MKTNNCVTDCGLKNLFQTLAGRFWQVAKNRHELKSCFSTKARINKFWEKSSHGFAVSSDEEESNEDIFVTRNMSRSIGIDEDGNPIISTRFTDREIRWGEKNGDKILILWSFIDGKKKGIVWVFLDEFRQVVEDSRRIIRVDRNQKTTNKNSLFGAIGDGYQSVFTGPLTRLRRGFQNGQFDPVVIKNEGIETRMNFNFFERTTPAGESPERWVMIKDPR